MKIIWYNGLFRDYNLLKKYILSKHSSFYFDYDIKYSDFSQLLYFTKSLPIQRLVINVIPTLENEDFKILSNQFILLNKIIKDLIITSKNDLFTLVLKKYISLIDRENTINYAFQLSDNVDDKSYFICNSSRPFLTIQPNIEKVILDDRANDNQGIIYERFSFSHKETSLITQSIYKKTKSQ